MSEDVVSSDVNPDVLDVPENVESLDIDTINKSRSDFGRLSTNTCLFTVAFCMPDNLSFAPYLHRTAFLLKPSDDGVEVAITLREFDLNKLMFISEELYHSDIVRFENSGKIQTFQHEFSKAVQMTAGKCYAISLYCTAGATNVGSCPYGSMGMSAKSLYSTENNLESKFSSLGGADVALIMKFCDSELAKVVDAKAQETDAEPEIKDVKKDTEQYKIDLETHGFKDTYEIDTVKQSKGNFGTLDTNNCLFTVAFQMPDDLTFVPFLHRTTFLVKAHASGVELCVTVREFNLDEQKFTSNELYHGDTQTFEESHDLENFEHEFSKPIEMTAGKSYAISLLCTAGATNTGTCPFGSMGMSVQSLYTSENSETASFSTLGGADIALLMNFHDNKPILLELLQEKVVDVKQSSDVLVVVAQEEQVQENKTEAADDLYVLDTIKTSSTGFGTLDTNNCVFAVCFQTPDHKDVTPALYETTFLVAPDDSGVTLCVKVREFDHENRKFCSDVLYCGPEQTFPSSNDDEYVPFTTAFETPVPMDLDRSYAVYLHCTDGSTNTGTCRTGSMGYGIRSLYASEDSFDATFSSLGGADVAVLMKFRQPENAEDDDDAEEGKLAHACKSCFPSKSNSKTSLNRMDERGRNPLYRAVTSGHPACVTLLARDGARTDVKYQYHQNLYHVAASTAVPASVLRTLVEIRVPGLSDQDDFGQSPMHIACQAGNHTKVKMLLVVGAAVDAQDRIGMTALHRAAECGYDSIITLLAANHAHIKKDRNGMTPLHRAAANGHTKCISRCLKIPGQTSVNETDGNGMSPLIRAILNNSADAVDILIKAGSDVNFRDESGNTGVYHCAERGYDKCLQLLIDKNANIDIANNENNTPLRVSTEMKNKSCMQIMRKSKLGALKCCTECYADHKVDVDSPDDSGSTPLHRACASSEAKHLNCVKYLIGIGAELDAQDKFGRTALHHAVVTDHKRNKYLKLLIKNGANPNIEDHEKATPLHRAIEKKDGMMIDDLLVAADLDVTIRLPGDNTLLHWYVENNDHSHLQLFLTRGDIDPNLFCAKGRTALHHAVANNYILCAEKLINFKPAPASDVVRSIPIVGQSLAQLFPSNFKVNINCQDRDHKMTPLHIAAQDGNLDLVRMLIKAGADQDLMNDDGATAFHLAVISNRAEIVSLFLEESVSINKGDATGNTPLLDAVKLEGANADANYTDVIEVLIKQGANLHIANENGETPLMAVLAIQGLTPDLFMTIVTGDKKWESFFTQDLVNLIKSFFDSDKLFSFEYFVEVVKIVVNSLPSDQEDWYPSLKAFKQFNSSADHMRLDSQFAAYLIGCFSNSDSPGKRSSAFMDWVDISMGLHPNMFALADWYEVCTFQNIVKLCTKLKGNCPKSLSLRTTRRNDGVDDMKANANSKYEPWADDQFVAINAVIDLCVAEKRITNLDVGEIEQRQVEQLATPLRLKLSGSIKSFNTPLGPSLDVNRWTLTDYSDLMKIPAYLSAKTNNELIKDLYSRRHPKLLTRHLLEDMAKNADAPKLSNKDCNLWKDSFEAFRDEELANVVTDLVRAVLQHTVVTGILIDGRVILDQNWFSVKKMSVTDRVTDHGSGGSEERERGKINAHNKNITDVSFYLLSELITQKNDDVHIVEIDLSGDNSMKSEESVQAVIRMLRVCTKLQTLKLPDALASNHRQMIAKELFARAHLTLTELHGIDIYKVALHSNDLKLSQYEQLCLKDANLLQDSKEFLHSVTIDIKGEGKGIDEEAENVDEKKKGDNANDLELTRTLGRNRVMLNCLRQEWNVAGWDHVFKLLKNNRDDHGGERLFELDAALFNGLRATPFQIMKFVAILKQYSYCKGVLDLSKLSGSIGSQGVLSLIDLFASERRKRLLAAHMAQVKLQPKGMFMCLESKVAPEVEEDLLVKTRTRYSSTSYKLKLNDDKIGSGGLTALVSYFMSIEALGTGALFIPATYTGPATELRALQLLRTAMEDEKRKHFLVQLDTVKHWKKLTKAKRTRKKITMYKEMDTIGAQINQYGPLNDTNKVFVISFCMPDSFEETPMLCAVSVPLLAATEESSFHFKVSQFDSDNNQFGAPMYTGPDRTIYSVDGMQTVTEEIKDPLKFEPGTYYAVYLHHVAGSIDTGYSRANALGFNVKAQYGSSDLDEMGYSLSTLGGGDMCINMKFHNEFENERAFDARDMDPIEKFQVLVRKLIALTQNKKRQALTLKLMLKQSSDIKKPSDERASHALNKLQWKTRNKVAFRHAKILGRSITGIDNKTNVLQVEPAMNADENNIVPSTSAKKKGGLDNKAQDKSGANTEAYNDNDCCNGIFEFKSNVKYALQMPLVIMFNFSALLWTLLLFGFDSAADSTDSTEILASIIRRTEGWSDHVCFRDSYFIDRWREFQGIVPDVDVVHKLNEVGVAMKKQLKIGHEVVDEDSKSHAALDNDGDEQALNAGIIVSYFWEDIQYIVQKTIHAVFLAAAIAIITCYLWIPVIAVYLESFVMIGYYFLALLLITWFLVYRTAQVPQFCAAPSPFATLERPFMLGNMIALASIAWDFSQLGSLAIIPGQYKTETQSALSGFKSIVFFDWYFEYDALIYEKIVLYMVIVVVCIWLVLVAYMMVAIQTKQFKLMSFKLADEVVVILSATFYVSIIAVFFSWIDCVPLEKGDKIEYLQDSGLKCWSVDHKVHATLALVFLGVYALSVNSVSIYFVQDLSGTEITYAAVAVVMQLNLKLIIVAVSVLAPAGYFWLEQVISIVVYAVTITFFMRTFRPRTQTNDDNIDNVDEDQRDLQLLDNSYRNTDDFFRKEWQYLTFRLQHKLKSFDGHVAGEMGGNSYENMLAVGVNNDLWICDLNDLASGVETYAGVLNAENEHKYVGTITTLLSIPNNMLLVAGDSPVVAVFSLESQSVVSKTDFSAQVTNMLLPRQGGNIVYVASLRSIARCFLTSQKLEYDAAVFEVGGDKVISNIAINAAGDKFVCGFASCIDGVYAQVIDAETTNILVEYKRHTDDVNAVLLLNGGAVATGSADRTIQIWDIESGEMSQKLQGHTGIVETLCMTHLEDILASAGQDADVILWNYQTGENLYKLTGHSSSIRDLCWISGGKLVSASHDNTFKVWQLGATDGLCLESKGCGRDTLLNAVAPLGQQKQESAIEQAKVEDITDWSLPHAVDVVDAGNGVTWTTCSIPQVQMLQVFVYSCVMWAQCVSFGSYLAYGNKAGDYWTPFILLCCGPVILLPAYSYIRWFKMPFEPNMVAEYVNISQEWTKFKEANFSFCCCYPGTRLCCPVVGAAAASSVAESAVASEADLIQPPSTPKFVGDDTPIAMTVFARGHDDDDSKSLDLPTHRLKGKKKQTSLLKIASISAFEKSADAHAHALDDVKGEVKEEVKEEKVVNVHHVAVAVRFEMWFYEYDGGIVSGSLEKMETNPLGNIRCALILEDKGVLLTGGEDKRLMIHSLQTRNLIKKIEYDNTVTHIVDGGRFGMNRVVFVSANKCVYMLRTTDFEEVQCFKGHSGMIWGMDVNKTRSWLVTASYDRTAKVWDIASGECLLTYERHTSDVNNAIWLTDTLVATASDDRSIRIWDAQSGTSLHTLVGHTGYVMLLSRTHIQGIFASGSRDKTVRIWDWNTGECLHELCGHTNYIKKLSLLPNGLLASGSSDNHMMLWKVTRDDAIRVEDLECDGVTTQVVAVTNAPQWLMEKTANAPAHALDDVKEEVEEEVEEEVKEEEVVDVHHVAVAVEHEMWFYEYDGSIVSDSLQKMNTTVRGNIRCALILEDKDVLLAGGEDGALVIHSLQARALIKRIDYSNTVTHLVNGGRFGMNRVVFVSANKCVYMLRTTDFEEVQRYNAHSGMIWGMDVNKTRSWLVTASYDRTAKVWDIASGECLLTYEGHTSDVNNAIWLTDTLVATASDDRSIRIWDAQSGASLHTLVGHTGYVMLLSRTHIQGIFASGSRDKTVRIWDWNTGECLHELCGHTNYVKKLSLLPNGLLASGSSDNHMMLWKVTRDDAIRVEDLACDGVTTQVVAVTNAPKWLLGIEENEDNEELLPAQQQAPVSIQEVTQQEPLPALQQEIVPVQELEEEAPAQAPPLQPAVPVKIAPVVAEIDNNDEVVDSDEEIIIL